MSSKKSNTKRVVAIVAFLLFCLVFAFSFWHNVFSDNFFKVFGFRSFLIAYTGSMEPQLNQNDLIIVKKYDFDSLNEGDIISFYGKNVDGDIIIITHKIEKILVDDGVRYLRTRGINLPKPDKIPVTVDGADDSNVYIGKMMAKSTFLGNLFAFITSPHGIFVVFVNLTCIFIFMSIVKGGRERCSNFDVEEDFWL